MLDPIRSFFQKAMSLDGNGRAKTGGRSDVTNRLETEEERQTRRLHVAACALLLELAHADDEFSDEERSHIEAVLGRHFALDGETATRIIELAEEERRNAIDLYQFTSLIRNNYDLGQKTLLAEIMWGLVLTDGKIAQHEGYMLRKIGNLLDLKPGYLADAKNRAEDRLGS
jgi:uncharacterized tellurite resistance protein B-like protein